MVRPGATGVDVELPGAGRAGAARSGGGEKSILLAGATRAVDPAGGDGDDCHGDCVAGDDFRRVLGDATGVASGLFAARAGDTYLGNRARADLHRAAELADADYCAAVGAGLWLIDAPCSSVWHCGIGDHGIGNRTGCAGGDRHEWPRQGADAGCAGGDFSGGVDVFCLQYHQDRSRRLVPNPVRPDYFYPADHVETRRRSANRQ